MPEKSEPIPEVTKSEKKELVAEELKDYFPDLDIGGLVVRRRKNSSASIDLDAPTEIEETLSTRRRRGSSLFEMSENGEPEIKIDDNPRKSSQVGEDDFDQFLAKGYRRRSVAECRLFSNLVDISNLEEPKPYRMRLATQVSTDLEAEPQRKERSISSATSIKTLQPFLKPSLSMSEDKPLRIAEAEVNPFSFSWSDKSEKKRMLNELGDTLQNENFSVHLSLNTSGSDIIKKFHIPRKSWRRSISTLDSGSQALSNRFRNGLSSKGYLLKSKLPVKVPGSSKLNQFQLGEGSSKRLVPYASSSSQKVFFGEYQNADFSMQPGFIKPNAPVNLKELLLECKQGSDVSVSSKNWLRPPKRRWFDSEPIPGDFLAESPSKLFVRLPRRSQHAENGQSPPATPTAQCSSPQAFESPAVRKRKQYFTFSAAVRKESLQLLSSGDLNNPSMQVSAANTGLIPKKFSESSDFTLIDLSAAAKSRGLRQSSDLRTGNERKNSILEMENSPRERDNPEQSGLRKASLKGRKLSGDDIIDNDQQANDWERSSDSEGSGGLDLTMTRQFSVGAVGLKSNGYSSLLRDIDEVNRRFGASSQKLESSTNLGSMRMTVGAQKELRSAFELGEGLQVKRTHSIGGSRFINPFRSTDLLGPNESTKKKFQILEHRLKKGAILSLVIIISESTTLKIKIAPGKGAPFETYKVCQEHNMADESPVPDRKLSQNADSTSSMEQAINKSQGKFRIVSAKPLIFNKDPIRKKLFSYTLDFVQEIFWFDTLQQFLELVDMIYNDLTNYYTQLMKEVNATPSSSKLVESGSSSALELSGKIKGCNITLRAPLAHASIEYPIVVQQAAAMPNLKVRPGVSFKPQDADLFQCTPLGNLKALKQLLQE